MTTDNSSPTSPGTPAKKSNTGKVVALTVTITVLAVAVVLLLWTQFNGKNTAGTSPTETASASATPTATPSAEASPSETTTEPTDEASTSTAAAATPLCTATSLSGSLDDSGGGAAGSVYMKLVLSNSGSADCILDGYPGVSLVKAGTIDPIGAPAERDPAAPSNGPITLGPGQGATATLRYTQAGNYPGCESEQADSVLVYPPSDTGHLEIAHPLTACSNTDIKLLTIGAFQQ